MKNEVYVLVRQGSIHGVFFSLDTAREAEEVLGGETWVEPHEIKDFKDQTPLEGQECDYCGLPGTIIICPDCKESMSNVE